MFSITFFIRNVVYWLFLELEDSPEEEETESEEDFDEENPISVREWLPKGMKVRGRFLIQFDSNIAQMSIFLNRNLIISRTDLKKR